MSPTLMNRQCSPEVSQGIMQVVPVASASMLSSEALAAQQAAEAAEYKRLQAELQTWCQGTAAACLLATLIFYSKVCNCMPVYVPLLQACNLNLSQVALAAYPSICLC